MSKPDGLIHHSTEKPGKNSKEGCCPETAVFPMMTIMINFSLSHILSVPGRLHHMDADSIAYISETIDTSSFTVEVY